MSDSGSDTAGSPTAAGGGTAAAGLADWDEWQDDAGDEDDATRSLFDSEMLPTPEAAFAHDAARHGFDVREFRAQVCGRRRAAGGSRRGWQQCGGVWGPGMKSRVS
jgi:hypothetical protein